MHHLNLKITGLAFLLALAVGSSTAMAQYGPWGGGVGIGWGAYPATNAMSAKTTIYAQKSAAQRQSLAGVQQRHTAQNQFLMSQSRGQAAVAANNSRAAAESFVQSRQPRQSVIYSGGRDPNAVAPAATPAAAPPVTLPTTVSKSDKPAKSYDQVVDWPSLLKASTFREPRVRIETILLKAEPGGPGLSVSDFNEIVLSINRMKGTLERMSAGLNAKEYIGLVNYLDKLAERAKAGVRR